MRSAGCACASNTECRSTCSLQTGTCANVTGAAVCASGNAVNASINGCGVNRPASANQRMLVQVLDRLFGNGFEPPPQ